MKQAAPGAEANVLRSVPFLDVADLKRSLRFYVDGLGFRLTTWWAPDDPDHIRWCWLERGGGALMLQERAPGATQKGPPGTGVTLYFICTDALALYREVRGRGVAPSRPFVGNGYWVVQLEDPDGYRVTFESPTEAAEESVYEDEA